jgi:hypothetical protein
LLLAFGYEHSVHKLSGTYPGEFTVSQIFGTSGTLSPRTIVNIGAAVYFLSNDGLCKYDGMSITPLKATGDRKLKDVWAAIDHNVFDKACAVVYGTVIYMAVCLDPSESSNTHVIEYDTVTQQYSLVELPGIDDFMVLREGQNETLLAISWGKVYRYDSGATFAGAPINAVWTSPEIDLGGVSSKKSTGYVYLLADATSLEVGGPVRMKISMIVGSKVNSKIVPLVGGKNTVRARVKCRGRSFRFRLENMDGNPLTIYRGIEIMVEEDPD